MIIQATNKTFQVFACSMYSDLIEERNMVQTRYVLIEQRVY